jgi:hypothetical protein
LSPPELQRGRSHNEKDPASHRSTSSGSLIVESKLSSKPPVFSPKPRSGTLRLRILDALQFAPSDVHTIVQMGTQIRCMEGTDAVELSLTDWESTATTGPERHSSFLLFQLQSCNSDDLFGTFVLELQELIDGDAAKDRWVKLQGVMSRDELDSETVAQAVRVETFWVDASSPLQQHTLYDKQRLKVYSMLLVCHDCERTSQNDEGSGEQQGKHGQQGLIPVFEELCQLMEACIGSGRSDVPTAGTNTAQDSQAPLVTGGRGYYTRGGRGYYTTFDPNTVLAPVGGEEGGARGAVGAARVSEGGGGVAAGGVAGGGVAGGGVAGEAGGGVAGGAGGAVAGKAVAGEAGAGGGEGVQGGGDGMESGEWGELEPAAEVKTALGIALLLLAQADGDEGCWPHSLLNLLRSSQSPLLRPLLASPDAVLQVRVLLVLWIVPLVLVYCVLMYCG